MQDKRKKRVRYKLKKVTSRKRLSVFRSNKHLYAQVIDDSVGKTLASASAKEKGIDNFCNVHDSFATHACDVDKLNESIREAFVEIFNEDLFGKLKKDASLLVEDKEAVKKFPEVPENGDLDLALLHQSKFFFA